MIGGPEGGGGGGEPLVPQEEAQKEELPNPYYDLEEELRIASTHEKIDSGTLTFDQHFYTVGEYAKITHVDYKHMSTDPNAKPGEKFITETTVKVLYGYRDKKGVVTHAVFDIVQAVQGSNIFVSTGKLMLAKVGDISVKVSLRGESDPIIV